MTVIQECGQPATWWVMAGIRPVAPARYVDPVAHVYACDAHVGVIVNTLAKSRLATSSRREEPGAAVDACGRVHWISNEPDDLAALLAKVGERAAR